MDEKIIELQKEIETLSNFKQEYASSKQSLNRMSTRLRKLCKRLAPTSETVLEMQKIAEEIRELAKQAT
jgi:methyl-accepting chemotaxis protein